MTVGIDVEHVSIPSDEPTRHRHALGGCRRLVEQRGVGDIQAGEVRDHRLEIEKDFEPALGDLGLIRGVGGVPGGIFEHVPLDHGGRDGVVISETDQRGDNLILRRQLGEPIDHLRLTHWLRHLESRVEDGLWHRLGDQVVQRGCTHRRKHFLDVFGSGSYMAICELL